MNEVKLTPTQHSLLLALSHKQMTITAVQAAMGGISKELGESLLKQLCQLHLITKYTNGQYRSNAAGARYLKHNDKATSVDVPPVAELVDVDRQDEKPAEDLAALLDMTPAVEPKPDPIVVRAEAETMAIVTQIQPSKPALPADIESNLVKLEKLLEVQPLKPMSDIDTKLQVLQRLADLLHPTIADVLEAIADDLQRVQQVAVDVSKAA